MKVAAAYENGEVFQHFGHTKQFKVYEIEDGKVVSSEIVETNGKRSKTRRSDTVPILRYDIRSLFI